jgi:carboxylesterase
MRRGPLLGALGALAGAAAGALAGGWIARRGTSRAAAIRVDAARRLPLGPDGVIAGAEPLALDGDNGRAVLLLHGFGDAPDTMRALALRLHGAGWTVRLPLLPGHGRTLDDFASSGADTWLGAARDAYAALRARYDDVAIVGLSMGAALGTIIAAESAPNERPDALVLLAPYLAAPASVRIAGAFHPLVALAAPWIQSRSDASIHDATARAGTRGYGVVAPHLLRELATVVARARRALPNVTAPTRVVQSRHDNRIPPAAAVAAFARLGAIEKEIVWLNGSGHVITIDYERDHVNALVEEWIAAH